jgi:hypothetical protein
MVQPGAQKTVATAEVAGKGGFTTNETVGQLLEFQLTGLLVVFVVLGSITLVSMFSSWLLKILAPSQYYGTLAKAPLAPPAPVARAAAAVAAKTIHPGLSNEKLLVILAAAAEEAIGKPVTVVSFSTSHSNWSTQGRIAIHSSH